MPKDLLILVINLDRAHERLAGIAATLARLALPWTRVRAVDGKLLTPEQLALLDRPEFERRHGMTPWPNEMGCYLSHLDAMRVFLASDARHAVILEDDAGISDALPAVLQGLVDHAERWDMVKLSKVHSGTPQRVLELAPGYWLAVMLTRCTGSSAYILNRHAAEVYLQRLLPMNLPYDLAFEQCWHYGLKMRIVTPTPVLHDDRTPSTIGAPPPRKFHWTRRWRTHLWRVGNEWRRVVYALGSLRRERAHDRTPQA